MSTINFITATQSSIPVTVGKPTAQQTAAAVQPQPTANTSSATISQAARDALATSVANTAQHPSFVKTDTGSSAISADSSPVFQQFMAEKFAGGNAIKSMIQSDPSNPMWTGQVESWAQHDFTLGHDVGYDCSGTKPGEPGRFLGGEQVQYAMDLPSKAGTFLSSSSNFAEGFKNGIRLLDNVSSEEKSSLEWAIGRANAQIAYENAAEVENKAPEKLDSESPIVQLITAAMKAMKHHPNSAWTTGSLTTADDLKRQPWFKGYESQLDQLMQQMQNNLELNKNGIHVGASTNAVNNTNQVSLSAEAL